VLHPVKKPVSWHVARVTKCCAIVFIFVLSSFSSRISRPQQPAAPANDYLVKLVCESADRIVSIRFGPRGARIERTTETRLLQSDISGPHGIAFSPDKKTFFVSIGHGRPYGSAVKYSAEDDRPLGQTQLGLFPATEDLSPDGNFLFVVNFNLHGDPVPSSVSVLDTDAMLELARIPTCVMPHGSRVSRDGKHHYSACMTDDLLVEIDTQQMKVARTFRLTKGQEQAYSGLPARSPVASGHAMDHGDSAPSSADSACSPTWAQPSADGKSVFAACNTSSEIVEIDSAKWAVTRRIPARNGVYNLAVSPDGQYLIATNKRDASVSIYDAVSAKELARLPTKRKIVHGVVVSPDGRYAFVTVEGVGSEPGTLEIIDLVSKQTVATVDTPPQAAGIDFWKFDDAR
jgi:DNA-binding beta-propeller fold protein YncE